MKCKVHYLENLFFMLTIVNVSMKMNEGFAVRRQKKPQGFCQAALSSAVRLARCMSELRPASTEDEPGGLREMCLSHLFA